MSFKPPYRFFQIKIFSPGHRIGKIPGRIFFGTQHLPVIADSRFVFLLQFIIKRVRIKGPISQEIHLIVGMIPFIGEHFSPGSYFTRFLPFNPANLFHRPHQIFEIAMVIE